MSGALRTFAGYHAGEREELTLVAGALRADGTSPMIGAGRPYLARATLVGVALGRMGAGEHADLMFEDVVCDPIRLTMNHAVAMDAVPMAQPRLREPGRGPRLRLWTTGAGRDEAARIFRAIFDEAEVDAAIAGMSEDEAGTIGLGPRRVRLLLVDVDPREFEGEAPEECAARGEGHEFGPHGPPPERREQCRYCGAPRGSGATEIVTYAIGIGRER